MPSFLESAKVIPNPETILTHNDKVLLQNVMRKPDTELTLDDASILLKALISS